MDTKYIGIAENCNLLTVSFLILNSNLQEVDSLNLALKQNNGYHIYPESLEVNKINIKQLDLIDARRKLLHFLQKNKSQYNLIPIGHNIQFDIKFIKSNGLLTEEEYTRFISYNTIDTIVIAQSLKLTGQLHPKQSLSLVNLCNSCNLKINESLEHSSEYNIKMTIKLLQYFQQLLEKEDDNLHEKNEN
jgi:DNA polymerase III epsilon subunit-like protein